MINISKSGNAIKFTFTDSDHYLYGNGEVEVPVNSLSLVIDESDFVVFKKASTNDTFITFNPANSNLSDKAGVIEFYKTNMVGSTGGGSESGMTPSEVQEMIDESISGKADTSVVNQAISEATQAILSVSGDVQTKVATSDFNAYSAATATALGNKQDALVYYSETDDIEYGSKGSDIAISQGTDENNVNVTFGVGTIYTEDEKSSGVYIQTDINNDDGIVGSHINVENGFIDISNEYTPNEGELSESHIYMSNNGSIEIGNSNEDGGTLMYIQPTGVTINDERVLTEGDVTSAITSASTNDEVAGAKAVYDAIQAGGGGGAGLDDDTQQLISTALNDLNDRKADLTELSKYQKKGDYVETPTLADYMTNASFDEYATAKERIISGALNDLNNKFGGIRLVKISQADYDNLATKDANTLYIINNVI